MVLNLESGIWRNLYFVTRLVQLFSKELTPCVTNDSKIFQCGTQPLSRRRRSTLLLRAFNSDAAAVSAIRLNAPQSQFPTTLPKASTAVLTTNCSRSCTFPAARQAKSDQCSACSNESPRFDRLLMRSKP